MAKKQTADDFLSLLVGAVNGEREAAGALLEQYIPLFKHISFYNGKFDEDIYQELMLHAFRKLPRFPLEQICAEFEIDAGSSNNREENGHDKWQKEFGNNRG